MDDPLQSRMRASDAIDTRVSALAKPAGRGDTFDVGDDAVTPPRPVQGSAVSPQVRVISSASAARRMRDALEGPATSVAATAAASRIPVRAATATTSATGGVAAATASAHSHRGISLPRGVAAGGAVGAVGATADTSPVDRHGGDLHHDVSPDLPLETQINLLRSQLRMSKQVGPESYRGGHLPGSRCGTAFITHAYPPLQDHANAVATIAHMRGQLTDATRAAAATEGERTRLQRAVAAAETAVEKAKRTA